MSHVTAASLRRTADEWMQGALAMAAGRSDPNYRALDLGLVAQAQFRTGDIAGSRSTFERAKQSANQIELLSNRAYTYRWIALFQAVVGDIESALQTARFMAEAFAPRDCSDIELVVCTDKAFDAVVAAQLKKGDIDGALQTARSLQTGRMMIYTHRDIAEAQRGAGDAAGAVKTQKLIDRVSEWIVYPEARRDPDDFHNDAPELVRSGRLEEALARAGDHADYLRVIAVLQAELGDTAGAHRTAERIAEAKDKSFALSRIAVAEAAAGDIDAAQQTIEGVSEARERAVVWSAVGVAWARVGDLDGAGRAFLRARRDVDKLERHWVAGDLADLAAAVAEAARAAAASE